MPNRQGGCHTVIQSIIFKGPIMTINTHTVKANVAIKITVRQLCWISNTFVSTKCHGCCHSELPDSQRNIQRDFHDELQTVNEYISDWHGECQTVRQSVQLPTLLSGKVTQGVVMSLGASN